MESLNEVNQDPRFQSYMSAEEDDRKIINSLKKDYYNKGVEQGIEQGIEKGIEQGIEQGIEKGRLRGRLDSAIMLIENGFSKEEVSKMLDIDISLLN